MFTHGFFENPNPFPSTFEPAVSALRPSISGFTMQTSNEDNHDQRLRLHGGCFPLSASLHTALAGIGV